MNQKITPKNVQRVTEKRDQIFILFNSDEEHTVLLCYAMQMLLMLQYVIHLCVCPCV